MSEKTDAARRAGETAGCGRAEELVTYLYGELAGEESRLFRLHLDACGACREELAALGGVREAVGVWRAEALGSVPSLNIQEAFAPAPGVRRAPARGRSAAAALREFFSLAPLWLRAGAAAAVLAVCALAALTLARAEVRWGADGLALRTGFEERVVKEQAHAPAQVGYTDEQVNALVALKVAEARARFDAEGAGRTGESGPGRVIKASGAGSGSSRRTDAASSPRRKRTTRRAPEPGDSLLAEDNLPRLSDLLNGSY